MNLEGRRITGGTIEVETMGSYRNTVNIYPGGAVNLYNVAVQSSSVPSIAGKKDLADYLRRCAERIELGEWPFGNNSPTVELGGEA